ncbi:MAG: DUF3592 domain-containing protein [Planctomycetaceae bacterium]
MILWVITIGFISVGVFLFVTALREYSESKQSRSWPCVKGTILSSQVISNEYKSESIYIPEFSYRYTVRQKTYTGERLKIVEVHDRYKEVAEKLVAKFPAGKEVRVFYNPQQPERSVLALGNEADAALEILNTFFYLTMSAILMILVIIQTQY